MNTNDLVYKIALRAKELGNMSLPILRKVVESQTGSTLRGDLIEEQLVNEFCEVNPGEIEDYFTSPLR